jgi:rubrerythrin
MIGAIRKRDVLAHPIVTIRCFGWNVFFRVLLARRDQTFLSILADAGTLRAPKATVPELVDRCIALELTAKRLYEGLGERFANNERAARFFRTLSCQERGHAELLQLCRAAAERDGWEEGHFEPWRDAVPRLERQMKKAEESAATVDDLADALRLVIRTESSELNQVFDSIVAASDSEFVRRLQAFHAAGVGHISYICDRIAELDASLASDCRRLRAGHGDTWAGCSASGPINA